jgi:GNAT superfamily N-acetyltransferase
VQPEILYREATSADVAAMEQSRVGDAEAGAADERMRSYFDGISHPREALLPRTGFVALDNNVVVGYIAGHLTRRFGYQGEVQFLYVAPKYRRQGIAAELLRRMAAWFSVQNATRVCVNVNVDSPQASPFYLSQGASVMNKYWYVWDDITSLSQ